MGWGSSCHVTLQRLAVGVGNEWLSCARTMVPACTPSPCHLSLVFMRLARYLIFFAPQCPKRKSRNRESLELKSLELIALTERKESYTLIPSQLRWLNCLYLAGCPSLIFCMTKRQDQTKTMPCQHSSSWELPPLPHGILLPPIDLNLSQP